MHTTALTPTYVHQHNTTHHHTTHSAPATLCNMSETQHHCLQQDQAHFIQIGTRSAVVCLHDFPDANMSQSHAFWPSLRCFAVAVAAQVGVAAAACWMLAACLSACVRCWCSWGLWCLCHHQETYVRFEKNTLRATPSHITFFQKTHDEPIRATLRFQRHTLRATPSYSKPLSSHISKKKSALLILCRKSHSEPIHASASHSELQKN